MDSVIKVFVSQPMKGRTERQILSERKRIEAKVKEKYGSQIEGELYFLDNFLTGAALVNPLFCLGHSLIMLSKADVAVFADGWAESRGCCIEHNCCEEYGVNIWNL